MIDGKGLIVTIVYLILEAARAEVSLADGRTVPANIIAYDHNTGFVLLRATEPLRVRPVKLGSARTLEEAAHVLVAGYGGAQAARPAIVVARRAFAGYWEYLLEDAIFTSPPYASFAGAALIDPQGDLLGIGSLILGDAVRGEQPVPGNMFVPIDQLKAILQDLLAHGRSTASSRPWLGIYRQEHHSRFFVDRVATNGSAANAGIKKDDIIVEIAGQPVDSMEGFYRRLWALGSAGVNVELTVLRGAHLLHVNLHTIDRYKWLLQMASPQPRLTRAFRRTWGARSAARATALCARPGLT